MSDERYVVRRLTKKEIKDVVEIQAEWARVKEYYPDHPEWLRRAIPELEAGRRIAFGAFEYRPTDEGRAVLTLQGSIIIKRGISGVIEAKNLIVRANKPEEREHLARRLIHKIESFATRRGFHVINIELPDAEREQINWFLDSDYKIRISPTHPRQPSQQSYYVFQKTLDPTYSGDPFDRLSVVRWLLNNRLGWVLQGRPEKRVADARRGVFVSLLRFTLPPARPARARAQDPFSVTGQCLVDLGYGTDDSLLPLVHELKTPKGTRAEPADVNLFVTFRDLPAVADACKSIGVRYIGSDAVVTALGEGNTLRQCPVRSGEIAGVLLDVGPDATEKIQQKAKRQEPFAYFVSSGLGLTLAKRESYKGLHAVFCSLQLHDNGLALMVWGCADITYISTRNLESAFESVPPELLLWDKKSDYNYYINDFCATFNATGQVPVYEFARVQLLPKPMPLKQFATKRVWDALGKDWTSDAPTGIYLDRETLSAVMAEAKAPGPNNLFPGYYTAASYRFDSIIIDVLELLQPYDVYKVLDPGGALRAELKKARSEPAGPLFANQPEAVPSDVIALFDGLRAEVNWCNTHRGDSQVEREALRIRAVQLFALAQQFLVKSKAASIALAKHDELLTRFDNAAHATSPPARPARFSVALSFASDHRPFVERVADALAALIGKERIFLDSWHNSESARGDADIYHHQIYATDADVIAVFLSKSYATNDWCRSEWRAIRPVLVRRPDAVMFFQFDDTIMPGMATFDGYVKIGDYPPNYIADSILKRHGAISGQPPPTAS